MRNYVFLGDSPTIETGFARVTENLLTRLNLPNKHLWGIGYDGSPHNFDCNIYQANPDSTSWARDKNNIKRFEDFLTSFEGEIILWTIHDPYRFSEFKNTLERVRTEKDLKVISYIPVDGPLSIESSWYLNFSDINVAYNHFGAAQIEKLCNKKPFIIPHGTDQIFNKLDIDKRSLFPNLNQDDILIGNVNSNSERKALHRTLEIFRNLTNINGRFKLYMHCPNNGYFNLKKLALELGVLDRVIFADPFFEEGKIGVSSCDKNLLNQIYNCFDLFLSTSIGEGWGLTAIEAASCSVPIIIPRHSSFSEIFHEDSAIFLEPEISYYYNNALYPDIDVNKATLKIVQELSGGEIDKKTKKAKGIVDNFNWDDIAKEWEVLLKNI